MTTVGDFLGLDVAPAVGAAFVAAAVAGLRWIGITVTGRRERERELYGKAYRSAMAWKEMLYRLRRRVHDGASEQALVDRFHDLQEDIDYYTGWTASEGRWIGRSYARLVRDIKQEAQPLIREAWTEHEQRPPAESVRPTDRHPTGVDDASERFLKDVRNHLSLWVVPKLLVVWRNSELQEEKP